MNSKSSGCNKFSISRMAAGVVLAMTAGFVNPASAQVVIICPSDMAVTNETGLCSAVVDFPEPEVIGASDNSVVACVPLSGSEFPVGVTDVVCNVTDEEAVELASCSFSVTVDDEESPSIAAASPSKSVLWPPNHKMVEVAIQYEATDNCSEAPVCTLSVRSNEPENGIGDGNTDTDWQVLDAHRVMLRSERSGSGNGRIYTVTISCADAAGNEASDIVTVSVPHDRGRGKGKEKGKDKSKGER